jgi:preprotein translocase subunit SecG
MKKITLFIFLLAMSIGYSQTTLQDFEDGGLGEAFGGAAGEIVADPAPGGTRGQVAKLTGVAGEIWQGINVNIASNYVLLEVKTIEIDVYSLSAITFAPKAQGGVAGSPESVSTATHTGSGWETLTVTFDQSLDGKAPANGEYSQFAIHYFWDTTSNGFGTASDRIFYIDNIKGSIPKDIIQDFEDGGLGEAFGGAAGEIVADPASGGTRGQVAKLTGVAGEIWQGINVNIASNYKLVEEKTIEIDVYSLSAITFAPKAQGGLAGAPESVSTATHTGSGWETLTVTFDQSLDGKAPANGEYSQFAIHYFWDTTSNGFGTASDRVFYVDNIKAIKVTLPVIQNPVGLPLTFDDASQLFTHDPSGGTGGAVAIENGKLKVSGNGDNWDNVSLTLSSPIDLSDAANNTITFTVEPLLVPDGEDRTHRFVLKVGVGSPKELDFTTTGSAEQTITLNYGSGLLNNYDFLQIFTDVAAPGKAADYLFDNISIGADPAATCTDGIKNGDEEGVDCGGSSCSPCANISLPLDFSDASQLFTYNAAGQSGGSVTLESGKLKFTGNGHAYDQAYLDLTAPFSLIDNNNNTFKITMNPIGVPDGEERTHLIRASFAGGSAAGTQIEGKSIGSGEQEVTFNFGVSGAEPWTQIIIFMDFGPDGTNEYNGKVTDYLISSITLGADPLVVQVPPTGAAPTPPARNAAEVISIYTKTTDAASVYTDITGIDFPDWGGNSGNVTPEAFENDLALKLPAFTYQGVEFPQTDLSGMTMLHLDIWAQTQGVGLDLIATGGASKRVNINSNDGQWSSVDIPLTDFTGLDLSQIFQMKFYGLNGANADGSLDIYLDNIYFYTGSPLNIDNNKVLNVNLYPNPTSGVLNISAENTIEDATIYNVLGTAVMSLDINNNSEAIDVSGLTSGIYLIKYTVGDAVGTAKFIKE